MEEIFELQKKLKDIQKEEILHKLSDRNIVELIQKLLKNEEFKVIHTTNGKEYLTPEQVQKEIQSKHCPNYSIGELNLNNGEVNVSALPNLLNVSQEVTNQQLEIMLKRDKTLFLINGRILTNYFLDNICHEVNSILNEKSIIFISDLAKTYDIPISNFKEIIEGRIENIIQGKKDLLKKLQHYE